MKHIPLFLLTILLLSVTPAIAGRRCTGSANCTACSSCEFCKHCNGGGGTCGVCSGGSHFYQPGNEESSKAASDEESSNTTSHTKSHTAGTYSDYLYTPAAKSSGSGWLPWIIGGVVAWFVLVRGRDVGKKGK